MQFSKAHRASVHLTPLVNNLRAWLPDGDPLEPLSGPVAALPWWGDGAGAAEADARAAGWWTSIPEGCTGAPGSEYSRGGSKANEKKIEHDYVPFMIEFLLKVLEGLSVTLYAGGRFFPKLRPRPVAFREFITGAVGDGASAASPVGSGSDARRQSQKSKTDDGGDVDAVAAVRSSLDVSARIGFEWKTFGSLGARDGWRESAWQLLAQLDALCGEEVGSVGYGVLMDMSSIAFLRIMRSRNSQGVLTVDVVDGVRYLIADANNARKAGTLLWRFVQEALATNARRVAQGMTGAGSASGGGSHRGHGGDDRSGDDAGDGDGGGAGGRSGDDAGGRSGDGAGDGAGGGAGGRSGDRPGPDVGSYSSQLRPQGAAHCDGGVNAAPIERPKEVSQGGGSVQAACVRNAIDLGVVFPAYYRFGIEDLDRFLAKNGTRG